ncbi:hypothetical protein CKA32_000003 [Geitlerinema sp. FC II]|nr:hypothetical protein [Geitlerinema sp. CS-897]PPT08626.1 hypothetical protein CKA32_000003 [Geitlerinema sp. FC II]
MSKHDLTLAIQFGSAFLIIFLLLGYDPLLSIVLAIAGGIAGSITVSGWNDKTEPNELKPKFFTEDKLSKTRLSHPTPLDKRKTRYLEKQYKHHRGRPTTFWERVKSWLGLEESGESRKAASEEESEESQE